jgi:hypothetical protein
MKRIELPGERVNSGALSNACANRVSGFDDGDCLSLLGAGVEALYKDVSKCETPLDNAVHSMRRRRACLSSWLGDAGRQVAI